MPLRAVRNKLREIRYYSATRTATRWTRALDIALAVALALALPVTWALDHGYVARRPIEQISGSLYQNPDGAVWAWTAELYELPEDIRGDAILYGAFKLGLPTEERGWPFVTSRQPGPTQLDVRLFAQGVSLDNAHLPLDSPLRQAIESGLMKAGYAAAATALLQDLGVPPDASLRLPAWPANVMVWSVLLPLSGWLIAGLLRGGWLLADSTRLTKRRRCQVEDRCVSCGYDLRGSVFSERCPECGALNQA